MPIDQNNLPADVTSVLTEQDVLSIIQSQLLNFGSGILRTGTGNQIIKASPDGFQVGNAVFGSAPFRVTMAGAATASSMTITGGAISGTPISSIPNNTSTDISLLEFTHNLVFSVTDADTIAWTSGTINLSNGRTFTISAGNTGNMTALTYIYLSPTDSSTVLQTTTTYSTAIGANKTLIGTAQNQTVTASFIPQSGGGLPLIDGTQIGALSIVAGNIAASTITAAKMNVSQLSAIAADLGSITAGSISVANGGNTIGLTPAGTNAIFSGTTGSPQFTVTPAGAVTASNITITGGSISSTPISSIPNNSSTDISLLEKTWTMVFSVTDADTIAWGAGTITLSNGRTFAIDAGNTGNMTALTYIYLDTAISSTVLQTTTTTATAMGANKILIGCAQNNTVTANWIPYGPGQMLVDGAQIGALSIVAGNIAASTITAGKLSVAQLSAIAADLGTITAGTVTGATIRTAATGARFNMDTTDLRGIDDASNIVFQVIVSGTDVGDVSVGRYGANEEGILWDKSAGRLKIRQRETKVQARFQDMTNDNSVFTAGGSVDDIEGIMVFDAGGADDGGILSAVKLDATKDFVFECTAKTNGNYGVSDTLFMGLKGSQATSTAGTDHPDGSGNMTEDHAGFIVYDAAGTDTLIASTANGTTQTKSSSITGFTLTNYNKYRVERIGSSIYFFVNNSLKATLTTNLIDDTTDCIAFVGQKVSGAGGVTVRQGWSYIEEV